MTETGPSNLPELLPAGTCLNGRYELTELLGFGDFGRVYRARDRQDGSRPWVAVKQLPMQSIVDCERQADLRAGLQHPAIPRIYDYFSNAEHAFMVQEWIAGCDLEALLDQQAGFLPEAEVLDWAIQLCDVLDYLHTHPDFPTVFRDMKPNNVMLDPHNRIHVVDFDLARTFPPGYFQQAQPRFAQFRKGLAIGTVGYSPPEQYQGLVTPQSDLFALGATLHHLLTRRDPRRSPEFSFADAPVRALNPAVSPDFAAVVEQALQLEPAQRYESAKEMGRALRGVRRA